MIKGMISEYGTLNIERQGLMTNQICPFSSCECGDWCPLFGTPEKINDKLGGGVKLSICKKELVFSEFKDDRGKGREK